MNFKYMIVCAIIFLALSACSKTDKATSEAISHDDSSWVEMDAFHLIMAEAFHPYKDSANLEPAKRLAEELSHEANQWSSAPLPGKVNNDEMRAQLNQLKVDTNALSTMIQEGASDKEIGSSLQALHDSFHRIMESWNEGPHEHQH